MRWVLAAGIILIAGGEALQAQVPADVPLRGPAFKVGGLKFTVPSRWQSEPVENPASRAGQWRIPPPHGQGEAGEAVAFYFGPGLGGNARDNVEAWTAAMSSPDGHPVVADVKIRMVNGVKITVATLFGTYNRPVSMPGIPPEEKPHYGLLGGVIENAQGNVYWRFTGPESLLAENFPLFNKILDSVKPLEK